MSAESQIDLLAKYILKECPAEIGNEGAGDVAVRLLDRLSSGIKKVLNELGVPGEGYPAPVANAVYILHDALGAWPRD
jgi:hypothetical protein